MLHAKSKISLIFLLIVALIGTLLRSAFLITIPFEFQNLVHAHSHVAFQGWVYTLMMLILIDSYLDKSQIKKRRYLLQFNLTTVVIIGILITFSMQGYGLYSIIFLTLFQLLNYLFIYSFFRDTKHFLNDNVKPVSLLFIKTGLWLGLLSTLMPIGIGIISSKGLNGSEIYNALVYTFLHLQYNGWFLFVALGLFYKFLENNSGFYKRIYAVRFYFLFTISVIPAISLSMLGMSFSNYILLPAYISAALQLLALFYFLKSFYGCLFAVLNKKSIWFRILLITFLLSFFLKVTLQFLSVFPVFKDYAFNNKSIVIAYIHLSMIGVISFLFLAMMIEQKWLNLNRFNMTGNIFLFSGFISTELLLLFIGLTIYYNPAALSIGSFFMAIGILFLILSTKKNSNN